MRRFLPTILAVLMTGAFVARGVWGMGVLLREPELVFEAPGEYRLTVPAPATYTLWYSATASIGGVYRVGEAVLPVGTAIEVTRDGAVVPTIPDASMRSDMPGGAKVSVLRFEAKVPGEYVITVSGFAGARHFEVTKGSAWNVFIAVFGSIGASLASAALAVLCLVLALTGVWPKRKPVEPPVLAP